jgi:hypothetical protein
LTPYEDIDFVAARTAAFEAVSRCYFVRGEPSDRIWYVQLEINALDSSKSFEVQLCLTTEFPLRLPYIFLSVEDTASLGFPPNINLPEGQICTFDRNTAIPSPSHPEHLVLTCLHRAREIIEAAFNVHTPSDYDDEYVAYWECTFPEEPPVDRDILSLHPDTDLPGNPPTYVALDTTVGGFNSVLYTAKDQFSPFQDFLDRIQVQYTETPTFYLGELPTLAPPFAMSGAKEAQLMKDLALLADFNNYAQDQRSRLVVTFTRTLGDRHILLGWRHEPSSDYPAKKHRSKTAPRAKATNFVTRFSPEILTSARLEQRTSGDIPEPRPLAGPSVLVAGLGSVGSNFLPLLETVSFTEYRLVDPEILELENIRRHLLGLAQVGSPKVDGMHDYLMNRNPLLHVETRNRRILEVIRHERNFLEAANYHFFCTGDTNSEMYVGSNIHKAIWARPSFFIWLEPYLAGGHCVYYDPDTPIDWEALFPNNLYAFNVISSAEHDIRTFSRRELGCHTSFTPFGAASVKLFLSAIFPSILEILKKGGPSRVLTWVGDKESLNSLGIKLADRYDSTPPFSLLQPEP